MRKRNINFVYQELKRAVDDVIYLTDMKLVNMRSNGSKRYISGATNMLKETIKRMDDCLKELKINHNVDFMNKGV